MQGYLYNFELFELLDMEEIRLNIDGDLNNGEYLKGLDEDMIWDAYKDVVSSATGSTNMDELTQESR